MQIRPPFMFIIILFPLCSAPAKGEFIVTYFPEEAHHYTYATELIKLALEKTRASYGGYRLLIAPDMPHKRPIVYLQQNKNKLNCFAGI